MKSWCTLPCQWKWAHVSTDILHFNPRHIKGYFQHVPNSDTCRDEFLNKLSPSFQVKCIRCFEKALSPLASKYYICGQQELKITSNNEWGLLKAIISTNGTTDSYCHVKALRHNPQICNVSYKICSLGYKMKLLTEMFHYHSTVYIVKAAISGTFRTNCLLDIIISRTLYSVMPNEYVSTYQPKYLIRYLTYCPVFVAAFSAPLS